MLFDLLITPIAKLLDKLIPDPQAREAAKLELVRLQQSAELDTLKAEMSAIIAEADSRDPRDQSGTAEFPLCYVYLAAVVDPDGSDCRLAT